MAKLQSEKSCLQNKIVELQSHAEQMERRFNEQKLAEDRKHTEQIQCLMKTNQQLKVFPYITEIHCVTFLQCLKRGEVQVFGHNSTK